MPPITRFWFDGDRGTAQHDGVTLDLKAIPKLPGLPEHLRAVEFVPAVRVALVRESGQCWREMTLVERGAVSAFLERVAIAVRGVCVPQP